MSYWDEQIKLQQRLLEGSSKKLELQLGKAYSRSAKNIIKECKILYLDIMKDGAVSYSDLMKYDRYYKLLSQINTELRYLGFEEVSILDSGLADLYLQTGAAITGNESWALLNSEFAKQAVNRAWCADGKTYSDRIWAHKTELQSTLQESLVDCVIQGKSHKELSKRLKNDFGVSTRDADRIARTELSYIQNQAAIKGYQDAGYSQYQFISAADGRRCDECGHLAGKIFSFSEAKVGVNFPPIHPNCRSNIIGYKE